jgi:hypothetical protein
MKGMAHKNEIMNLLPTTRHLASQWCWWKNKESNLGDCPITLEALSTLPYPPFLLRQNYFDGLALASYMVSRGIFQNPLTREELTVQDCRRLDEYLEAYCYNDNINNDYNNNNNNSNHLLLLRGSTRPKVSVTEAFALRNSIHVVESSSSAASTTNAEALRNAATSALVGLFVYGNHRPRRQQQRYQYDEANHQRQEEQEMILDPFLLDWGFDLSRTVVDNNTPADIGRSSHGFTVIDDDEENVLASQQSTYRAVQEAFPPLLDGNAAGGVSPSPPDNYRPEDRHFLEHLRSLSLQDQQSQQQHLARLRRARKELLQDALERRDQRRKQGQLEQAQNAEKYQQQKQEETEIQHARAEIEAWREEQWEKLRLLSEQQQQQQQRMRESGCGHGNKTGPVEKPVTSASNDIPSEVGSSTLMQEQELVISKKKANAAAKRKRAKERKKNQRVVDRNQREREELIKSLQEKKNACTTKCNACGMGILDCGFEKYGQLFCSTKCARSGNKIKQG